jgi:hypothetical protein
MKGSGMGHGVLIENIEEMRCRQGIYDVELREEIRGLRIGDLVNLTFLADEAGHAGETLPVRITCIQGHAFRGKLARRPMSSALAHLRVGSSLAFTAGHIHSLTKGQPAHES